VRIIEMFSTETSDEGMVTGVIRPAAVLPDAVANSVVRELAARDVRLGGVWLAEPALRRLYDEPWADSKTPEGSELLGTIEVAYGTPTRYEITVFRAAVTRFGAELGWTVETLCDEALGFGGISLAMCPRADLKPPPAPFVMR
jgi:hypothetical protein